MMHEAGFPLTETTHAIKAPIHLKLAEKYYGERIVELRALIEAEESQYKEIKAALQAHHDTDALETASAEGQLTEVVLVKDPSPATDAPPLSPIPITTSAGHSGSVAATPAPTDVPEAEETPAEATTEGTREHEPLEAEQVTEDIAVDETEQPAVGEGGIHEPAASTSKPVSARSEAVSEADSTRPTRRSIPPPSPVTPAALPPKKRGRPRKQALPDPPVEAETDEAMAETQPDDDVPLSAAIRRGKRKASTFTGGLDSPRDRKRAREDSEPVDDEDPGSAALRRRGTGKTEEQVALKRFQTVITMVHNQISQHRNGNIFHNPIKPSEASDYHDIVKRPIDLKTIKARIKDGHVGNSLEYQRDIYLMFANAMMYNRPGSDVHAMAEDMMLESDAHINSFRQTEGLVRGSRG
ncbi:Bromo domain-containing protein [Mycena kentingensis (nom. inval.)]|nr:Bromo domain-containing protein [Mycena kentingensis (nom. inval.)]